MVLTDLETPRDFVVLITEYITEEVEEMVASKTFL